MATLSSGPTVPPADVSSGTETFDVAIIGAGVIGAAVARELAGTGLRVVLLDARADVGDATSKAALGTLHTGFDASPGTDQASLLRRGHTLLSRYAARAGIEFERRGALAVAWTDAEYEALPRLREVATRNGYPQCEVVGAAEVYVREPHLGPGARGALWVPDEAIICPWTTTLAFATEAVHRGVELRLRHRVDAAAVRGADTALGTDNGTVRARWVVNAAGLHADAVDRMFGRRGLAVTPQRGEVLVYDSLARPLVDHIIAPLPSPGGTGVSVLPTVYGTVALGPVAEAVAERSATHTTAGGTERLLAEGRRLLPALVREEVIANYAGLYANTGGGRYAVELDAQRRYLLLGGFGSTGLTASLAVAERARALLTEAGLPADRRTAHPAPPPMPSLGEADRPYRRADLVAADPDYGRVVCFCENVSKGEIRDALRTTIPPADLRGLSRRTRAMNGRCQGTHCGAEVTGMWQAARRAGR